MNSVIIGVAVVIGLSLTAWTIGSARASEGIETPRYESLHKDGDFELRQYPDLVVATVKRDGSRRSAVQRGFRPLAGYIFAKGREGDKIAMTAPVLQAPAEATSSETWDVSFIMPAHHELESLPLPKGDVRLERIEARKLAAVRFSGVWTDARFQAASDRLEHWITEQGLTIAGDYEYGYYNDPFTPAWLRRNEVWVPVN